MSDNAGSVSSVSETLAYYASLRMSFPGARIQPSSLDAFYAEAEKVKDQLPMTVVGEVGDGKCHGSLHCHVYDSKCCTTTVSVSVHHRMTLCVPVPTLFSLDTRHRL